MTFSNFLFVYGTLLKTNQGGLHPFFQQQADYVADGFIPGNLYEIDGYPGAVLMPTPPSRKVYGELYRIHHTSQLLSTLDEYEECSTDFPSPHEYRRIQYPVTLADDCVHAWVYVYNFPITGLHQISSGDYRQFLRDKQ